MHVSYKIGIYSILSKNYSIHFILLVIIRFILIIILIIIKIILFINYKMHYFFLINLTNLKKSLVGMQSSSKIIPNSSCLKNQFIAE
jgi:hypothetical protein